MRRIEGRWRPAFWLAVVMTVMAAVSPLSADTALAAGDGKKEEKFLVDSTIRPETKTRISSGDSALNINGREYLYADTVALVDENAEPSVAALYQYLKAVGESDSTLYGHMEDTVLKAGSGELTESDTMDVTGSLAAVIGFDCGELFRGYAAKYNARHPEAGIPETNSGNIQAAALFTNEAVREGAVITLSAHVPNFSAVPKKDGSFENSYDGFDFLAADSYNLTGDAANQILPGGRFHDRLTAYLDMIADYAKQVEGPILFRPWHENTGSWFWWGKAFCDAETYKSIYKFTVEYLRDEKEVHNILYVYGPGSEAASMEEYEERYPGDSWVDMVGFDTYDNNPVPDGEGYTFQKTFEQVVKLTDAFAKKHGKLFAVTETGMAALPETGNRRPEWYSEILDILTKPEYNCCYFMLWSNYSRTGSYYSPFVQEVREDGTLFGHELLDPFIEMYNSEKSIFAADQKDVIGQMMKGGVKEAERSVRSGPEGYITSPTASSRVLEPQSITARLNREGEKIHFIVSGGGREWKLEASVEGKQAEARLDETTLLEIGQAADGKVALFSGEEKLQEISVLYNIKPRPEDPYLVDDFESYAGLSNLLMGSWSTNKDSGCSLELSLIKEYAYDGEYALSFDYTETKNGWAGCELSKEADWSGCNALQFLTVPDGNNQKIVVQINTSDGGSYEAYLQDYPEYAESREPLLVTLPFHEFTDKNGAGKLTPAAAASVRGIGLWLNAIPDSEAIDSSGEVKGLLVYDAIRAGYVEDPKPLFEKVDFGTAGSGQQENGSEMTDQSAAGAIENQDTAQVLRRNQVVMVISGAVLILSLFCLLRLILGMRKEK